VTKLFTYATAVLGAALIVGITVFPSSANLWITFALAIALTAVTAGVAGVNAFRRQWLAAGLASSTVVLGIVLIVASRIFEGVSRGWLVAIAGGLVEFVALAGLSAGKTRLVSIDAMREPEPAGYGA
jgi:hypothetical protein